MKLETIILSEISQSLKDKNLMSGLLREIGHESKKGNIKNVEGRKGRMVKKG
jgi:hypothetical protein